MKKYRYFSNRKNQKNFSYKPQTILQAAINLSLASGTPIPYDISVKRAREKSEKIPEEIKKEFRDRLRAGDLSVWQDERLLHYLK